MTFRGLVFAAFFLLSTVRASADGPGAGSAPPPGGDGASLDAPSAQALQKTQVLLTTPSARAQAVKENQGAQIVDSQVRGLAGTAANTDAIYGLSSDVFGDLAAETHGDPAKMQELLEKAKNDPKWFADHLSEKNKAALHDLAGRISGAPTTAVTNPDAPAN